MAQSGIILFMNRILSLVLVLAFFFALPLGEASAQVQEEPVPQPQSGVELTIKEKPAAPLVDPTNVGDSEITVMKDNFASSDYVNASMENLSKLYWRLGVFKPTDKKALDNYLIINECEVYKNFFKDDFEWASVRKATQDMMKQQAATFSNKFKVLVPIDLGRYDMDRGGFMLTASTSFVNSRRVQVTGGENSYRGCGQQDDLAGYPSRVVLILNKPFTFNFIKVDEHVAQAFLLRKKYNPTPLPHELRNKGFQRVAFARMRVTFVRHQGTMDEQGGRKVAILYGTLDGIDIFEDLKEEMLLASINYQ